MNAKIGVVFMRKVFVGEHWCVYCICLVVYCLSLLIVFVCLNVSLLHLLRFSIDNEDSGSVHAHGARGRALRVFIVFG